MFNYFDLVHFSNDKLKDVLGKLCIFSFHIEYVVTVNGIKADFLLI
jgi:hypothetical protein